MSVEKLAETAFPNRLDRNMFLSQLAAIQQHRRHPIVWYWYGSGNNGKSTMINALAGVKRLPSGEHEEVYAISGNKIVISNMKPMCEPSELVTEFRVRF